MNNPVTDGVANLLNTTTQYLLVTDSNNNNRIRVDWRPSKREIQTRVLLLADESVNKVQLQRS